MRLVYTPHAEGYLLSAIRWYNEQQARLGERFHSAVREREALLKLFPEHGERYQGSIRRAKVRSFPHFLLYDIQPGLIVVVAVVHGARGSEAWKTGRLVLALLGIFMPALGPPTCSLSAPPAKRFLDLASPLRVTSDRKSQHLVGRRSSHSLEIRL